MFISERVRGGAGAILITVVLIGALLASGMPPSQAANSSTNAAFDDYYGTVAGVQNMTVFLRLRTGRIIAVDASRAILNRMTVVLWPGREIVVHGKVSGDGVLHAKAIWRENAAPAFWPPDGSFAPARTEGKVLQPRRW